MQNSYKPSDIAYREPDFYVNALAAYLEIGEDEARQISLGFENYEYEGTVFYPSPTKALMYLEEMYIYERTMAWDEVFNLDSIDEKWEN